MYNFLDPKLLPKASCDTSPTDNYEATNLISEKEAIRARGFLAYTVAKPPVTLNFEFICPIDISHISLNTTVGNQRCTGIELFAKTPSSNYVPIARAIYDKSGITFCTSRIYSKTSPPDGHSRDNELVFFKRDKIGVFSNTSGIKIVIFRTARSVPCLGSIKVFGEPSRQCSQVTRDTLKRLMGGLPLNETKAAAIDGQSSQNCDLKIPDDFVDDLTCEIMAIPMTLPSGKTIDRDTLEKHCENEKSFGRKPCDPFTGLKFTETRRAVMNVALKSRIDMFLLQNSSHPQTFRLKRALGGSCVNSYSKRTKFDCDNDTTSSNFKKCCVCGEDGTLYVIPCRHFYCRVCLLAATGLRCNTCGKEFVKNDVERLL